MATSTGVEWRVQVDDDETTAMYEPPPPPQPAAAERQSAVFVCAHGAGGHMSDRGMLRVAETLRSIGLGVVRFNFVYREKKSGRPDPMPRLEKCVAAVVARTRQEIGKRPLLIGGRSMGGRAASMLAADGFACDGLLLLAYPLHPAGRPEQLRDAHLPAITVPVLCFSGTRDALCRRDLMETALRTVRTNWTMHWLDGADHSFHVLKSSGRTDAQVFDEIAGATSSWVRGASFEESMTARSSTMACALALVAVLLSCNLDTTPPGDLPHFAPAWQLVAVDGQRLPDTLALNLENSPPNTLHKIEAGAIEFTFPRGTRFLRWTLILRRLTDSLRFTFSFDANYVQVGADSIVFPTSRSVPPEFFGGKAGDSLTVVTIWLEDLTTPAALVGGSHTWRFARDTLFK